jgi:hypothetical protein
MSSLWLRRLSCTRALIIVTCPSLLGRVLLQRCAGRSGEVAALTYDGMAYDPHFQCLYIEVPQWKTSKYKKIALIVGADRHCCWFTSWADMLVSQAGCMPMPQAERADGDYALWLCYPTVTQLHEVCRDQAWQLDPSLVQGRASEVQAVVDRGPTSRREWYACLAVCEFDMALTLRSYVTSHQVCILFTSAV